MSRKPHPHGRVEGVSCETSPADINTMETRHHPLRGELEFQYCNTVQNLVCGHIHKTKKKKTHCVTCRKIRDSTTTTNYNNNNNQQQPQVAG